MSFILESKRKKTATKVKAEERLDVDINNLVKYGHPIPAGVRCYPDLTEIPEDRRVALNRLGAIMDAMPPGISEAGLASLLRLPYGQAMEFLKVLEAAKSPDARASRATGEKSGDLNKNSPAPGQAGTPAEAPPAAGAGGPAKVGS